MKYNINVKNKIKIAEIGNIHEQEEGKLSQKIKRALEKHKKVGGTIEDVFQNINIDEPPEKIKKIPPPSDIPILKPFKQVADRSKYLKNVWYGYSFGELGADTSIEEKNSDVNQSGASMDKELMALVNGVAAADGEKNTQTGKPIRELTDDEMDRLISYKHGSNWSNRVNRALSNMPRVPGKDPEGHKMGYYKKYSKQIGVSGEQARKILNKFGLTPDLIKGIHWGSRNKQSTRGMNKFRSVLSKIASDPNSPYWNVATRIIKYTKKRQGGYPGMGLQKYLNKELEKSGYGKNAIKSIWGKGGRYKKTLNYSVVLSGKNGKPYVFTIYTQDPKLQHSHRSRKK